jgi:hypothetical protein
MRKLLYILFLAPCLLFSAIDYSQVNATSRHSAVLGAGNGTPIQQVTYTISAWVYQTSPQFDTIVNLARNQDNAYINHLALLIDNDNRVISRARRTFANEGFVRSPSFPATEPEHTEWHHFAGVFTENGVGDYAEKPLNPTNIMAYLDGVRNTESAVVGGGNVNIQGGVLNRMSIGAGVNNGNINGADRIDGLIAHVAVWNVALTDNEISSLANGASPRSIRGGEGLLMYFPMRVEDTITDVINGYQLTKSEGGVPVNTNIMVVEEPPIPNFYLGEL